MIICCCTVDEGVLMAKRDFYVRESELDDFQRKILNSNTDKSFIVQGCAGSGKSILALWKAHDIQKNNKGSVQVIVYTKALKSYMEAAMRDIGIDSSTVDYYHQWDKKRQQSKYIIVDEAQDFSQEAIDSFRENAEFVVLYGDSAQQMYIFRKDNPPMSMSEIEHLTSFPKEQLVYNHRLPKKIARVAQCLSNVSDVLDERCRNEGSEKPYFLQYDSISLQLDGIVNIVRNRDFEDVGILLPDNDAVDRVAQHLRDRDIQVESKSRSEIDFNWSSSLPKLMTYWQAKGLQFEAVFIPILNPLREDVKPALYVAMTRTYQSLYVMYSDGMPPIFSSIPQNLYDTSLTSSHVELL